MTVKNSVSETTATSGGAGVGGVITLTGQENAWNPTFAQAFGGAATDIPVTVIVGDDWQTCRVDFNGTTGLTVQSIQSAYKGGVYDDVGPTGVTLTGTPVAQVTMNAASLVDNFNAQFLASVVFEKINNVSDTNPTVDFRAGNKALINNVTIGNVTLQFPGIGNYVLEIENSDTLGTITPSIYWDGGTPPTWGGTSTLYLYYNGTIVKGSATVSEAV